MPVSYLGVTVPYERWMEGLVQPVYSQLDGQDEASDTTAHNGDVATLRAGFATFASDRQDAYDNWTQDAITLGDLMSIASYEPNDVNRAGDIGTNVQTIGQLWPARVTLAAAVKAKLVALAAPAAVIDARNKDHARAVIRAAEVTHEMREFARKLLGL